MTHQAHETSSSGAHASTLMELEVQVQQASFIGRRHEISLWRNALSGTGARVFYVHGPAGVGKTTLLQAFAAEANRRSVDTIQMDARDLEPRLASVAAALDSAWQSGARDDSDDLPRAFLLDTYEHLWAIEPLVRRELLRRIRGTMLLVVAGRLPPSAEWRALSLWGNAIVPIALRNLSPAEGREYLARRGIHGQAASSILAFSHGHPLALALAAEVGLSMPAAPFAPGNAPDVIATLYEYFVRRPSSPQQRAALEVSALLHTTSESTLSVLLKDDAASVFEWLRTLSFMKVGQRGVFPHDLAREVILADLRWRNADRFRSLAQRAQCYFLNLMGSCTGGDLLEAIGDFWFCLCHDDHMPWPGKIYPDDGLMLDELRAADEPVLRAAVLRHEGQSSVQYLCRWLASRPSDFRVTRGADGIPLAFLANLRLDLMSTHDRDADPLVRAVWDYTLSTGPQKRVTSL